jgi:hypothetical protein
MIVNALGQTLPERYIAEPQVHLGSSVEFDVATYEEDDADSPSGGERDDGGGIAIATWAPPRPTLAVATDLPARDEYEVRVYDTKSGRRLVAAIEIVSPANKDRPEHRRAFVARCAALILNGVSIAIIDLVTTRTSNLYGDLMDLFGEIDPSLADCPPALYARRLPLGSKRGRLAAGDLGASPIARPSASDTAALARRQPRGAPRTGSELRGDVPHPPHSVDLAHLPRRFATVSIDDVLKAITRP